MPQEMDIQGVAQEDVLNTSLTKAGAEIVKVVTVTHHA
jgi:hypothetical protein